MATFKGTSGNNILTGTDLDDILNGGGGNDTMIGGLGNDTYYVNVIGDLISETSTLLTEIDTIFATISYTLGNHLENLQLTGSAAINGSGNMLDNTLTGNSGNNILLGFDGNDTLTGAAGNDTLDGGSGADLMSGGNGSDVYHVDNSGDIIKEFGTLPNNIDTVKSAINYTLGSNLENLQLTGSDATQGTGNSLNNIITGNSLNNLLLGGAGNDWLDGGLGNDTLSGGNGSDTYVINSLSDVIIEVGTLPTDIDTVQSSISYTLGNQRLENLTLSGTTAIYATGNNGNNVITGNNANNILNGLAGNDTLDGGRGIDVALLNNSSNQLTFSINPLGQWLVKGTNGIDTLNSIEKLQLQDGTINLTNGGEAKINAAYGVNFECFYLGFTTLSDGGFVVTYSSPVWANDVENHYNIYYQRFEAAGNKLGNETLVSAVISDNPVEFYPPDVTSFSNGDYIVTWGSPVANNPYNIFFQRFDIDGNKIGEEKQLNNTMMHAQILPKISALPDGGCVIAWMETFDSYTGIQSTFFLQRFNADGSELENARAIDTIINSTNNFDICTFNDGSYIFSWTLYTAFNDADIFAQRFDAAGNPTTPIFQVASNTADDQYLFEIQPTSDGGCNIIWLATDSIGSFSQVYSQPFDADGNKIGSELLIIDDLKGWQSYLNLYINHLQHPVLSDGSPVWVGFGIIDDELAVITQRLHSDGTLYLPTLTGDEHNNTIIVDDLSDVALIGMAGNDRLQAGSGNDSLEGGINNDTLNGGAGSDTLLGGAGADKFVLNSTIGSDIISDFVKGADDVMISMAGINVGDGDALLERALIRSTSGGFTAANELVIFTGNISGNITTTNAAAMIGSANEIMATGSTQLFAVDNGTYTQLFLFTSADGNAIVAANELTLLATINGVNNSTVGDYLFQA